jgi:hypothetical protein
MAHAEPGREKGIRFIRDLIAAIYAAATKGKEAQRLLWGK